MISLYTLRTKHSTRAIPFIKQICVFAECELSSRGHAAWHMDIWQTCTLLSPFKCCQTWPNTRRLWCGWMGNERGQSTGLSVYPNLWLTSPTIPFNRDILNWGFIKIRGSLYWFIETLISSLVCSSFDCIFKHHHRLEWSKCLFPVLLFKPVAFFITTFRKKNQSNSMCNNMSFRYIE